MTRERDRAEAGLPARVGRASARVRPQAVPRWHGGDVGVLGPTGLLALQRSAGNRAVGDLLAFTDTEDTAAEPAPAEPAPTAPAVTPIGPAPVAFGPPGGLGGDARGGRELGSTDLVSAPIPQARIRREGGPPGWQGRLEPEEPVPPTIDARAPLPGVYDFPARTGGPPRKLLVTEAASAAVTAGEQEHTNDIAVAHRLAYGAAAAAINRVAAQPVKEAPDVREGYRLWHVDLNAALPPALRFPAEERPGSHWAQVFRRLYELTLDRDARGWHTMRMTTTTAEERREHGVPAGVDFDKVSPDTSGIGREGSEARAAAAVPGLEGAGP
jgi:hypothetical protein